MDRSRTDPGDQAGQATPEYAGLVLLLATVLGVILTVAGPALPGGDLARAIGSKLVCAVRSAGPCGEDAAALAAQPTPLQRAYGGELAAMVADHAPVIWFEQDDFASLPVDYRECQERSCADTISHGSVQHTQTGLEPTVFTHVVDCRDAEAAASEGYDCSGERAGNVYLQYWFYYPDSATEGFHRYGYHADDWEGYQVKVDPETGVAEARASSHHGYNGRDGDPLNDWGEFGSKPGWDGSVLGEVHVAAGSHAGMTDKDEDDDRHLDPSNQRLTPLEPIAKAGGAPDFAITPPWEKGVWADPESTGT